MRPHPSRQRTPRRRVAARRAAAVTRVPHVFAQPSASNAITIRVELEDIPGTLGRLTSRIGELGGSLGAIDLVDTRDGVKTRDITVNTRDEAHAKELGPRNIRVNAVNPGMVSTEGSDAQGLTASDFRKQIEAQTPLGRIGVPADVAPAVVFLASPGASWITGEILVMSGGFR